MKYRFIGILLLCIILKGYPSLRDLLTAFLLILGTLLIIIIYLDRDLLFISFKIEYFIFFTFHKIEPKSFDISFSHMARVFVFSKWLSPYSPSIKEVTENLPDGARIIAYNINYTELPVYYMVAFDNSDDIYFKWCDHKDNEVPIYLEVEGKWRLRS